MLKKIGSVVRFVPDIEAAAAWYAEILGSSVEHENEHYAFVECGGQVIGFHPADAKCPGGVGGTTVYWEVEDLTGAIDTLLARGAALHRGPVVTSLGARVAMLIDPFGCTIGLDEAPGATRVGDVSIREAQRSDTLCLSVLAMQVFLDTYATQGVRVALAREVLATFAEARFYEALSDPSNRILIAERDQHLIGFAHVCFGARQALAPGKAQSELLRLYVQEPFTSRGVGTRLLGAAEEVAAGMGTDVLWLTPWVYNNRAIAFYGRRGYADHGLTYFLFEGESHENRVLAKSL